MGLSLITITILFRAPFRGSNLIQSLLGLIPFFLLAYIMSLNSLHCPTSLRPNFPTVYSNTSLLLASQFSNTGVIVVGEHETRGQTFRYLRADHSILGGMWIGAARNELQHETKSLIVDDEEAVRRAESIYVSLLLFTLSFMVSDEQIG